MLSVFLLQLAGGCMVVLGMCGVQDMAWRYLRLMAVISLGVLLLAGSMLIHESGSDFFRHRARFIFPLVAVVQAVYWIAVNAMQGSAVKRNQGAIAFAGGLSALVAACQSAVAVQLFEVANWSMAILESVISIVLGAGLIGTVTAGMLLGHRYLTDTEMTIAPLRRLTNFFVAAVILRAIWVAVLVALNRTALFSGGPAATWTLLMLCVRFGVGIVGTGVFAYMVWDCVKRRSTQSATGILYLTMVFVFIGELTGQYLMRTAGLPV